MRLFVAAEVDIPLIVDERLRPEPRTERLLSEREVAGEALSNPLELTTQLNQIQCHGGCSLLRTSQEARRWQIRPACQRSARDSSPVQTAPADAPIGKTGVALDIS